MVLACPGCGQGSYTHINNFSYANHHNYCSGFLFIADGEDSWPNLEQIINNIRNNNGYSNRPIMQVEIDSDRKTINFHGLLQAYINNNREAQPLFIFPDNDENRWESANVKALNIPNEVDLNVT